MKNIEELFISVKEAEVNAHLWHLQTSSYAEHKAFEELYTGLRDNLDSLIEQVQGKVGIKINPTGSIKILTTSDSRTYLTKLAESIEKFISVNLSKDKDLENTALLLLETLNKVRYLLTLS
jgi:DNA-binding ferritin-like protein